jgi:hypothetical protein
MSEYSIEHIDGNEFIIKRHRRQFPVSGSHFTVELDGIEALCQQFGTSLIGTTKVRVERCTNWLRFMELIGRADEDLPVNIPVWGVDSDLVARAPRVSE